MLFRTGVVKTWRMVCHFGQVLLKGFYSTWYLHLDQHELYFRGGLSTAALSFLSSVQRDVRQYTSVLEICCSIPMSVVIS